jgi:isovaleryl-CoA dehydrogenase
VAYQDALARVIEDVVAPTAGDVDRNGTFPRVALDALGEAGILGLCSAEAVGGGGKGLDAAADVVASLAERCGSTAMIVLMHYAATAVIEAHGPDPVRAEIAAGRHLSTLAFSEVGSRSHFWAPQSTARLDGDRVHLDARKSWVTSAGEADSYVWSSRPVAAPGPMTLWLIPSSTPGLEVSGPFDGLGLRGNGSRPMTAQDFVIPEAARLGDDGAGLDIALSVVLPWFLILSASASLGMMRGVVAETGAHLTGTRLEHLDQTLAQQPVPRAAFARIRVETDSVSTLIGDTLAAIDAGRADAQLRVLEVKAAAGDTATRVTEQGMRICGGAAFRKELGIERRFRDAQAAQVMAPTTDALLDFIGRALCGLPLLDADPA